MIIILFVLNILLLQYLALAEFVDSDPGEAPPFINPQGFRLMLVHRIWVSVVLSTHLLRSFWPERTVDQSVVDLRWEITRAEALILRSSQELDRCISASKFYTDLVKVLGLLIVQLAVVLVFWWRCIRTRAAPVEDTDSETDTSPVGALVTVPSSIDKRVGSTAVVERGVDLYRTGPLRPSDLRRLVKDGSSGAKDTGLA